MSRSPSVDVTSTNAVVLTPAGRGAIAVILVAGPDAVRAVERCFTPASGRPIGESPIGRVMFGRWGGAGGEELVVCRRSADEVEVHCHGGVAAVEAVVARLVAEGCRATAWQDWLRATVPDPIRAAAQIALAEAPTARTAGILLYQFHGALGCAVRAAISAVRAQDWRGAADALDAMLVYRDVGLHLTRPWQVVLTGAANVGKSSLINALAGYERVIVSAVPGTTRDVVTTTTAIDGWPVQLADTAGIRTAVDELEAAGIALATSAVTWADLVVVVEDATELAGSADEIVAQLPASVRVIRVRNKIDLLAMRPCTFGVGDDPARSTADASALTGEGVEELLAAIGRALVPLAPPVGAAVPFTAEQVAALCAARASVDERDMAAAMAAVQSLLAQ